MQHALLAASPPPIRSSPGLLALLPVAIAGISALLSIPNRGDPVPEWRPGVVPVELAAWLAAGWLLLVALHALVALSTRIVLRPDGVVVASGLLRRQRIFCSYDRFQCVSLMQGFLERAASVATVELARPTDRHADQGSGTTPMRIRLDAAAATALFDLVSPRLAWRFIPRD